MTSQYFWDRVAGRDPDLRAADADRERTAERLRTSHAEGRLDLTELQQRLERCYQSKTVGELHELVRDLAREVEQAPSGGLRLRRWRFAPLVPILIVLLLVSAVAGHHGHHVLWLSIPVVFVLLRMSWWRRRRFWGGSGYGSSSSPSGLFR